MLLSVYKKWLYVTSVLRALPLAARSLTQPLVEAIAEAARRLDDLRRNWLNPDGASESELKKRTLTNLYNERPTWLKGAHEKLDLAVFAVYEWSQDLQEDEILVGLMALNKEREDRTRRVIIQASLSIVLGRVMRVGDM